MGHFYEKQIGIGKDRQQAENDAISTYLHEHGHRHNLREVLEPRFIRELPPVSKEVREVRGKHTYIRFEPDPNAPKSEWLQEWEFTLHTHA